MKSPLIGFLILFSQTILSQNLVLNGGFETIERSPDNYGQINLAKGWYSINKTPDLYNKYSNPSAFNNAFPGLQSPRTGNGFAGFLAGEYETFQTKLIHKLNKDNQYRVEFFLKTAKGSECALTPVYGLLTRYSNLDSIYKYEKIESQVCINDYSELLDVTKWVRVEGIYTAIGEEKYFTISYINTNNKHFCLCSYFVDDISVTPLNNFNTISQEIASKDSFNYRQGDVFILRNVNFAFDKSELLTESYKTLDELLKYLQRNEGIIISINGHTDNVGIEKHNYELSIQRAKAVFDYLLVKGISSNRMTYEGYGSSQPINDNSSEANRQNNRRVEIKIVREK